MKRSLLVLSGPTASGKTRLAIELAKEIGGEIINADSVQVYRGFDIGSAKPSAMELADVPHHLVSILDPDEEYNAGRFREMATAVAGDILSRGKIPVVTGGTGLYIRALLCGLVEEGQGIEGARTAVAEREAELRSAGGDEAAVRQALHQWLATVDPRTAAQLKVDDISRVRRALVFASASGGSLAAKQADHRNAGAEFRALVAVLLPRRETLYRRIDDRVEEMLSAGLVEEVKGLCASWNPAAKPFGSIGYRHALRHLKGEWDSFTMCENLKRDTRRFAKRQMTWWRHQPDALSWKSVPQDSGGAAGVLNEAVVREQLSSILRKFTGRETPFDGDEIYVTKFEA